MSKRGGNKEKPKSKPPMVNKGPKNKYGPGPVLSDDLAEPAAL